VSGTYRIAVIPGDGIGVETTSDAGGSVHAGTPNEVCVQVSTFMRLGTERIARYAFELARRRTGQVASATKSNGLPYSMTFWDSVIADVSGNYGDVNVSSVHIDALGRLR
jgi:tartrate dehydrogenase/decarboxylase / D-malate dehydrogenase